MGASERTPFSDVCRFAGVRSGVESSGVEFQWSGIQGREKTGRREPLSPGELHLPAAFLCLAGSGVVPTELETCRIEAVWWPRVLIPSSRSWRRLAYISQEPARTLPPSPLLPISPPPPGGGEQFSAPAPVRGLLGIEVPDAYTGPFSLTAD